MAQWYDDYQVWLTEGQSLSNAQNVADHFGGTDWTSESIAALCGNMRHESSINPDMYEYGYDWADDRGYGLVQWTPRSKYWDWATARGLDQRAGDSQLQRIDYEVENNIQWIPISDYNNMTFAEFRQNAGDWSVGYLTEAFTWCYERPNQQAGEDSMPDRKAFADRVYTEVDFSGSGGTSPAWPTTDGLEITSPYGWRTHPITGEDDFHAAIDITGNGQERPIYATQRARVIEVDFSEGGGHHIRLEHLDDTYFSQYLHLASAPPVAVNQEVAKGEEIGTMGTTGSSTGIHLDFAIATSSTGFFSEAGTIDPEDYLQMQFSDSDPDDGESVVRQAVATMLRRNTNMRRDGRRR